VNATLDRLLKGRTKELYAVVMILWVIPALALSVLGLVYLWQAGWFWWFSAGLVLLSLISWLARYLLASQGETAQATLEHLDPRPNWSSHDHRVWEESLAHIESEKLGETPWADIPRLIFEQLAFVATAYHGKQGRAVYAFSVPELLLMMEIWSRDYRAEVIENVPLIQEVKVSTMMDFSGKANSAQRLYRYLGPVYRSIRTGINPVTGLLSEASSHIASRLFSELGVHMQHNMKVTLFEEVTKVAIDLYSGRLKLSEQELLTYRQAQGAPELEEVIPLTVIVVGQVNAGKSSLINALKEDCVAEVDATPATAGFHHHHVQLNGELDVYLTDTPGLDGSEATVKAIFREALQADLVIWVSQANQPAKALDKQFLEQWNRYFESNLARKKPPILLATTHNDLLPPAGEWHPPYDMTQSDKQKVKSMTDALAYTRKAIGLPEESLAVPVALLAGERSFNLDVLRGLLQSVAGEARSAQLNRQRLDAQSRASVVRRALKQSAGLMKSGVKIALK
jgi:uncharacterized protein